MDQDDAALKDNYFPDEIAAMQTSGTEGSTTADGEAFFDDYLLAGEADEAKAEASYRAEHPEGKDVQS
jgi:type VI secretion system secreted protein VgrG